MGPPFAGQRLLLSALLFATAVVAAPRDGGYDCEATCGQIVARQRKEIARLKAELRKLRRDVDPVARRTGDRCLGYWPVSSHADVEAFFVWGCRAVGRLAVSGEVTSLAGLASLETAESIQISDCSELTSLVGLEKLAHVTHLVIWRNAKLTSLASLRSLEVARSIRIDGNAVLSSLAGLEKLTSVDEIVITDTAVQSLTGLDNLTYVGDLDIRRNSGLQSLSALGKLARVGRRLKVYDNDRLESLTGLECLESAEKVEIQLNDGLLSLTGLEGLVEVGSLDLLGLAALQSVAGLRNLVRASRGGIHIQSCPSLHSLDGLGALRATSQLRVEYSSLTHLGGPFATGARADVVRFDEQSWPGCTTPHERMALLSVAEDKNHSFAPEARWGSECGTSLRTFSCTKGHPCNVSLVNHTGRIFISGRFTGCGACSEKYPQGNVGDSGTVDLGFALWDEDPGLRSICRCGGDVGPMAQLLLRGPRWTAVRVCSRGRNCTFTVEGEALERTDRVVLMSNCSTGNPQSGFAASWTAVNTYVLHDPAIWYAAPPNLYQVCWRAPCASAPAGPRCPAPEDRYFHAGEVELFGAYPHNYESVLGGNISFAVPNIGFGVSDGDRMRLRRTCSEADEEGIDVLSAVSLDMVFDFGRLTEDRVQAGSYHLCWCQERDGTECNAGWHFRAAAGVVQIYCPAGQELVSSRRCHICPAGKQQPQPGLGPCSECPAGQFSLGGKEVCEACPGGRVAGLAGSSACVACLSWQSADVAGCSTEPPMLVLLALFCLLVGAFCALLAHSVRKRLLVVDVSLVQDRTIVTTFMSHGLANFGYPSFPVKFHGTGHPGLDSPAEPFQAKVKDAMSLELLTCNGESISQRRLDTSMGTLTLASWHELLHQRWLLVPMAVALLVLLTVIAALYGLVLWAGLGMEALVGAAAAALVSTTASVTLRRWPRVTPLERHLSDFQLKLAQQPGSGKRCRKGPDCAIAVGKLHELLQFFREFIRDRPAYYLDTNIVRPLTKAEDISYAELAGAERVEWFVSHFWGTPFEHLCASLRKHAEMVCGLRNWTCSRYWVCLCSNNQHHIAEEVSGGLAESSFYLALKSDDCRGTCMVLDDKAFPLTRTWCIFELLQTFLLSHSRTDFNGLFLCTSGGVLNTGGGSPEVAMALVEQVAGMDLQTAQATSPSDAKMIHAKVLEDMGSFGALKGYVCRQVRSMLLRAQQNANLHFDAVLARLDRVTVEA